MEFNNLTVLEDLGFKYDDALDAFVCRDYFYETTITFRRDITVSIREAFEFVIIKRDISTGEIVTTWIDARLIWAIQNKIVELCGGYLWVKFKTLRQSLIEYHGRVEKEVNNE